MLRKILKFGLPLIIIGIAISIAGYLKASKPVVEPKTLTERVWTVAVIPAKTENVRPRIKLFGEIVSGRTVDLRPQVAGKILRASPNLVEGGVVRAGEVIVDIDPFDYQAALRQRKAELLEAQGRLKELKAELSGAVTLLDKDKSQVALRRKNAERRAKLRGSGAGTAKASDDARLALSETEQRQIERQKEIRSLRAAIEQQQAIMNRLEVMVEVAKRDLGETRIVSPVDGFVSSVETAEGKWLNVGDNVAKLIDGNRLEAKFHISRTRFKRLLEGGGYRLRPAEVIWQGRSGTKPYTAYIDRVGSEVDASTGGVNLYAKIKTKGAETILRPGAFVEVHITDKVFGNVVRLPGAAIYNEDTIYIVEGERLASRKVRIVSRTGNEALATVVGLKSDDRIVTTRLPEASPGLKVRIQ
ncbi:MAG: efflux RND transporter periplasmic adaptor subunit [Pseudomonadota bacterium]|nr:efflux RND transporter periplasmic adaptor subunit [Pseudomonadota bacterium]